MTDTFDTPETEEVLQEDEREPTAVPVCVYGVVQTEEMPTRIAAFRNVALDGGAKAVRILTDNPRRKRVVMWPCMNLESQNVLVCVSDSEGDANQGQGALLQSGSNAIARFETTYSGELWAKTFVSQDTAGNFTGLVAATDDVLLSIISEEWAH